jgi:hypothetical protein
VGGSIREKKSGGSAVTEIPAFVPSDYAACSEGRLKE